MHDYNKHLVMSGGFLWCDGLVPDNTIHLSHIYWRPYITFGVQFPIQTAIWTAVYQNLKKAQRWWGMVARVLAKTGATVQYRGVIYKALDQSVLMYGSESWAVTWAKLTVLEGFHHGAARRITSMTVTCGVGGEW